ncbi:MAG: DJ-1/PfpI family protein [Bacteroidota bacterium]
MKIAYIVFDGITLLDFIGAYDPISRLRSIQFLPDLHWDICAMSSEVKDSFGMVLKAGKVKNDLSSYDVIIVPGGSGTNTLVNNKPFISWLQTASPVPLKCSICTGSLLLGAAGFLQGKRATTHFNQYKALAQYGCTVFDEKIVDDGNLITAGAVSSSLQLGIYLANKWCGPDAEQAIRKWMDFAG